MKSSVVINNYNNGAFIQACLESVFNQSTPPDEIIVYDDGSSDSSLAYLRSLGPRIRLIEGRRDTPIYNHATPSIVIRQSHAIHQGVAAATGDWIFLLDGDDVFLPKKLAEYTAAIAAHPDVVLVHAPMIWTDDAGHPLGIYRDHRFHQTDYWRHIRRSQDCDICYPTSSLAVKRSVLTETLPFDFSLVPDLASDTRIAISALFHGRLHALDHPFTEWRQRTRSMSRGYTQSRTHLVRQTQRRTLFFNHLATRHGVPHLHLALNPRYYLQLLALLFPRKLIHLLAATRQLKDEG